MVKLNSDTMKIKILAIALLLFCAGGKIQAQRVSLSTNLTDWANFGTANLEAGLSVSQHFSILAGGHYNPWTFATKTDYDMINQQTTGYVGARYWPWYVNSGWWIGAKAQYSDARRSGIWRPALEEMKSVGGGISFGYTIMLHKNLNLEFGAGAWGGRHLDYTLYECPKCMRVRKTGPRNFIAMDDVSISLMCVF